jgi:hypothetical protein
VALMIQVHLMELFAQPAVLASWVGKVSLFLGGPPAAPVFMLIMGYYAAASTRSTGRQNTYLAPCRPGHPLAGRAGE